MDNSREFYNSKAAFFSKKFEQADNTIRIISYIRLTLALGLIICFYFSLTANTLLFYLLFLLIAAFVFLVAVHSRLFRKRDLLSNHIRINMQEMRYLEGDISVFQDGKEFIDYSNSYTFDLDIFGRGSLFQSLCRTVTLHGKKILAERLSSPVLDRNKITASQQSVGELKDKVDFRQKFQATGMLLEESAQDVEKIKTLSQEPYYFVSSRFFPYLLYLMPVLTIAGGILSILVLKIHILFLAAILANMLTYGMYGKKINKLFARVSRKKNLLENYSELFAIVEEETFQSHETAEIKKQLENASLQFRRLANLVGWLDYRLNILVSPFINLFLLFDLQICYRIEKWREENDAKVLAWIETAGKLDALISLGNFSYNHPAYIFPELTETSLLIEARGLCHPLILRNKAVANDFKSGNPHHISVITGANMAGKSTFLRTLGINTVLSYAGAPVAATYFKVSLMEIMTSMRISDSLQDDTSYFYAELQRLKSIRLKVNSGIPLFIFLDEMLKGTNSKDKQQGSIAFIEKLIPASCLVVVATHDLAMGNLEEKYPGNVKNFCFESFLEGDHLKFDYQIRAGIAQNTNASFLMRTLGII